jgi:hypothetical protein
MIDFYYIDLYFDPARHGLEHVVESCVTGLMQAGCTFRKVVMARPDSRQAVTFDEHVSLGPADLPAVAAAFASELEEAGQPFISFPPLGRVMFSFPFAIDEDIAEDVYEEEDEMHGSHTDIGLTFTYTASARAGRKIKATLNLWEEYVLTKGGSPRTNVRNMQAVIGMIEAMSGRAKPYFGAMDDEIHLDTDVSYDLLMSGKLPKGNEFVFVGPALQGNLDMGLLKASGRPWRVHPDGSTIIQFADKWNGMSAV